MTRSLLISAVVLSVSMADAGEKSAALGPFESDADPTLRGRIDELVLGRLERMSIEPARLCSDSVFVRRAYLDVIGTLPTQREARAFLLDGDPEKRSTLIEQLLEREEFADYWALKWSDLLRVKSEFPIKLWPNAVQAYHRWIRTSIKSNMPYDRFARQILTASGSNFRVPPANFYRAIQGQEPRTIAQAVALTFMGVRTESWTQERLAKMSKFFSFVGYKPTAEWKEEIVFFDSVKAGQELATEAARRAVLPDGSAARLSPEEDPREVFADWLISAENPWFGRNIVNRIWYSLHGRGIVHQPDDFGPENPPVHPELLDYLQGELVGAGYDLKHIYRLVLNSSTYQLSSIPRTENPLGEAHFAFYPLRQVDAEVLIDALCQITGTREKYSSPIPEPFTFIPEGQRSIALADGSITSSFLEMFGRPPRDTGLISERNNRPTASQRLHFLNSSHIRRKIEQGDTLRSLSRLGRDQNSIGRALYLMILSRFPTEAESKIVRTYFRSGESTPRQAAMDLVWALINSPEFLYRH